MCVITHQCSQLVVIKTTKCGNETTREIAALITLTEKKSHSQMPKLIQDTTSIKILRLSCYKAYERPSVSVSLKLRDLYDCKSNLPVAEVYQLVCSVPDSRLFCRHYRLIFCHTLQFPTSFSIFVSLVAQRTSFLV